MHALYINMLIISGIYQTDAAYLPAPAGPAKDPEPLRPGSSQKETIKHRCAGKLPTGNSPA